MFSLIFKEILNEIEQINYKNSTLTKRYSALKRSQAQNNQILNQNYQNRNQSDEEDTKTIVNRVNKFDSNSTTPVSSRSSSVYNNNSIQTPVQPHQSRTITFNNLNEVNTVDNIDNKRNNKRSTSSSSSNSPIKSQSPTSRTPRSSSSQPPTPRQAQSPIAELNQTVRTISSFFKLNPFTSSTDNQQASQTNEEINNQNQNTNQASNQNSVQNRFMKNSNTTILEESMNKPKPNFQKSTPNISITRVLSHEDFKGNDFDSVTSSELDNVSNKSDITNSLIALSREDQVKKAKSEAIIKYIDNSQSNSSIASQADNTEKPKITNSTSYNSNIIRQKQLQEANEQKLKEESINKSIKNDLSRIFKREKSPSDISNKSKVSNSKNDDADLEMSDMDVYYLIFLLFNNISFL